MNFFSESMDRVRAEPELKEKTKAFIRAALAGEAGAGGGKRLVLNQARKRFRLAVSLAAACLVLTIGGCACWVTPVNYVSVDINPSVEFSVNLFGRVVRATAYNEDGARLLEAGSSYAYATVEEAVRALVEAAAGEDYLADDGSSVIAVTAESRSEKAAAQLQAAGETGAGLALQAAEKSAVVYADRSDLQLRRQAAEAGISPGKYRLILMLKALDPDVDVGQYQNAKVTDIIAAADALMTRAGSGWQNGAYAAALERVRTAAQAVRKAGTAARQGQSGNDGQNEVQNPGNSRQNQSQAGSGGAQPTQNRGTDTAGQPAWKQDPAGQAPQSQSQNESAPEQRQSGNDAPGGGAEHAQPQEPEIGSQAGSENPAPASGVSDGVGQSGGTAAPGSEQAESAPGNGGMSGGGASSGAQPGNGSGGGK